MKSMTFTLALYVTAILVGFCLQFHFRKRFRRKIRDSTEGELFLGVAEIITGNKIVGCHWVVYIEKKYLTVWYLV